MLENAAVVSLTPPSGAAHWFVVYSGGSWDKNTYSIGYADCGTSLAGPCVKKTPTGSTLMSVQAWQFSGGKSNGR